MSTDGEHVNFDADVTDLSLEELREEYEELTERRFSHTITEEGRERRGEIWTELLERTDVEQPECPECGARSWGFSDHTECMDCEYGPRMNEQDLIDDIQTAWDKIAGKRPEEADA